MRKKKRWVLFGYGRGMACRGPEVSKPDKVVELPTLLCSIKMYILCIIYNNFF